MNLQRQRLGAGDCVLAAGGKVSAGLYLRWQYLCHLHARCRQLARVRKWGAGVDVGMGEDSESLRGHVVNRPWYVKEFVLFFDR